MLSQKIFILALIIGYSPFVFGFGYSNRGLDTQIDTSSLEAFGEKCGKAYADMKEANPKEFQLLKDAGYSVFDLSQPRDQVMFQIAVGDVCASTLATVQIAALESNVNLKTFREIMVYRVKSGIDAALKMYDHYKNEKDTNTTVQSVFDGYVTDSIKTIRKLQPLYQGLTGQLYGPKNLEVEKGGLEKQTELRRDKN